MNILERGFSTIGMNPLSSITTIITVVVSIIIALDNSPPRQNLLSSVELERITNLHDGDNNRLEEPYESVVLYSPLNTSMALTPTSTINSEAIVDDIVTTNELDDDEEPYEPVIKRLIDKTISLSKDSSIVRDSDYYWGKLYSIESKSGDDLFTPALDNKGITTCEYTEYPCGHHQISLMAIKDLKKCVGKIKTCMKDRLDFEKSFEMAKDYHDVLVKQKCVFEDYWIIYTSYNQGCYGIRGVILASKGLKVLPKHIKVNMANNINGLSVKKAIKMPSKIIAKKYLNYWKDKWENHQIAGI